MMNLRGGSRKTLFATLGALFGALFALGLVPAGAVAEDDEESMSVLPATPDWFESFDLSGRYVAVLGSESKYREDHNIQTGANIGAGFSSDLAKGTNIFFDGLLQPVERQGYGRFGYEKLGAFSFDAEVQAWSEFYNTRPGVRDATVLGSRINNTGIFPNTTNSRALFGGGKPSVDWLTLKAGGAVELPGPFNDVYGGILYRDVGGDMSLLKGGTIQDPLAIANGVVAASGPGTVFFDFPGVKGVDYESIGGNAGLRSTLGGLTWRFDASAFRHEVESSTREANFGANLPTSELETFGNKAEILTARTNLVVSRQVTPSLFLYAGGAFSWSQSEPDPSQNVQTGFFPGLASVMTRTTVFADVKRLSESASAGLIYRAMPSVVMTGDVSVRANQQDGDLTEIRNEATLLTGDTGNVTNNSERDYISVLAKGDISWKATRRLSFKTGASYKYSEDDINSSRQFAFVVAKAPEIEDYDLTRETIKAGASGTYRFKGGRKLEVGYDFTYDSSETDINRLLNQFVIADYERFQHKPYANLSGRIAGKWRGDLRFQYVFEERDMDAPRVNAVINPTADNGEVEFQGFTIVPTVTYQHSANLSGYVSVSIGRQEWELSNAGAEPAGFNSRFSSFEYKAITETATLGVNWSPMDNLTGSASYTIYVNDESVENIGHNALIRGAFGISENVNLTSDLRYLGYAADNNTIDDYDAIIFTLGFSGKF